MAPLWQGAEQHSLTSTSQKSPMKPGGQLRKQIILSNCEAVSPRRCFFFFLSRGSDALYLQELLVFFIYRKLSSSQLWLLTSECVIKNRQHIFRILGDTEVELVKEAIR